MWSICLRLLVITAVCLSSATVAQSDLFQFYPKRASLQYCGERLSNALKIVCKGIYNTMFKKAQEMKQDDPTWPEEASPSFPFLSRPNAGSLIPSTFRRHRRGVTDECCRKSCTFSELQSYCGSYR